MGLDMYAWAVDADERNTDTSLPRDSEGRILVDREDIHYWRKHHDLHGWMEELYTKKGGSKEFNCEVVRLTLDDLESLEMDVDNNALPPTTGFFFGDNPPDKESAKNDRLFIKKARKAIKSGKQVYYTSWW